MVETTLNGIPASRGIAIGLAFLVDRDLPEIRGSTSLDRGQVASEVARFKAAVKTADQELSRLIRRAPQEMGQHLYVLEMERSLLKDKLFYGRTIETIQKARVNAEYALKTTVDRVKAAFARIEDAYLRERGSDVASVYHRVLRNLMGGKAPEISAISRRVILVARDVSPAEASQLDLQHVLGFVTDLGGKTSHTAIIARTLGIPAVMGLPGASESIRTGDLLVVDGGTGVVVVNPDDETLARYEELRETDARAQARLAKGSHLPAATSDGFTVSVCGNMELKEEVVAVLDRGGDGVGLYRTEFLYLNRDGLPGEDELFENYKEVAELMAPRPVTIRTLDVNGDKVGRGLFSEQADNPALGLRAIRFCLAHPEVFQTQLRAILRAAAFGNVRLLFPMISGLPELLAAKKAVSAAADALDSRGVSFNPDPEIGVMIEVPSAAVMADVLAEHVKFFSVGTNDLIQYTLAVDRGNKHVAHLFESLHPAVIRLLAGVAAVCRDSGVRLAMCGEMAADPFATQLLLGLGFSELSMHPAAVGAVKNTVRALSRSRCEDVAARAVREKSAEDVRRLLAESSLSAPNGRSDLKSTPAAP